jgi:hypothetical protein
MNPSNGEIVGAPCEMRPGLFPHERWIEVDAEPIPLLGFADIKDLQTTNDERGFIKGIVVDVSRDLVVGVRVFAEFFWSGTLVYVRRELLTRLEA